MKVYRLCFLVTSISFSGNLYHRGLALAPVSFLSKQHNTPMKKILVPTDFSECAKVASETAIRMAEKSKAEIIFLHYMSIPVNWIHMEHNQDKMYPDVTKKVREITQQLDEWVALAHKKGIKAHRHIGFNEGPSEIIQHIHNFNIELIIMGSHGARGIKEFFLGSNAQRMIREANVPVLIVKKELQKNTSPTIVFVSDFELEMLAGFRKIMEVANWIDATIQLLYINTPDDFEDTWTIRAKMEKFKNLARGGNILTQVIDTYDFEEGLSRYCKGIKGGIVAMVTHHKIRDSKVDNIVNHLELPFININD